LIDIILDDTKKPARGHWKSITNQRAFMDQLAIKLDIKKPEDWYKVTTRMVVNEGGGFVISYYNGSVKQGIEELYGTHLYSFAIPLS
jgi:hypothetical protein